MAKTYIHQKKTTWPAIPYNVLDHRKKIEAATRNQTVNIRNNPQTYLDIRHSPLGAQRINQTLKPYKGSKTNFWGLSSKPHGTYRYVPNTVIHTDLQIPTVKAEITNYSTKYREKLNTLPNELIPVLLENEEPRRLKRLKPTELITWFL